MDRLRETDGNGRTTDDRQIIPSCCFFPLRRSQPGLVVGSEGRLSLLLLINCIPCPWHDLAGMEVQAYPLMPQKHLFKNFHKVKPASFPLISIPSENTTLLHWASTFITQFKQPTKTAMKGLPQAAKAIIWMVVVGRSVCKLHPKSLLELDE